MSEKYKIAIITRTYPPKSGGISAAHYNLTRCLDTYHDVKVFAFDDDESTEELNVVRAKTVSWMRGVMSWLARLWVRRYVKGASVVNCERILKIQPAIWKLNKSIRVFNPDFILCPDNYVPALALKKPKNTVFVWIAHNNFRRFEKNPIATDYTWIDLQLAHRFELRASRKADVYVAVSKYMADVVRTTLEPGRPIRVIMNYVDRNYLDSINPSLLQEKLGAPSDARIIHIPSGGTSIKGERYTFEIIRRLGLEKNVAFFVSGPINRRLKHELKYLRKDIIVYAPGLQDYEMNLRDIAACELTISPTLIENLSSAIIESLVLGVPVVTFDVGGNRELISSGENGVLVKYLDVETLINSSKQLLEDELLLNDMKSAARSSMSVISNPDRVLSEYESLFSEFSNSNQNSTA